MQNLHNYDNILLVAFTIEVNVEYRNIFSIAKRA